MSNLNPKPGKIISYVIVIYCIVYALAWCGNARAAGANLTLMSGFLSEHPGSGVSKTTGKPYRQNNIGLGIRIDEGPLYGMMFGTYRNSHDKQSLYIAKEWKTGRVGPFQLGLVAGGATGYKSIVMPIVAPEFIVNMWRTELVLLAQPIALGGNDPMVAVQLRWKFW